MKICLQTANCGDPNDWGAFVVALENGRSNKKMVQEGVPVCDRGYRGPRACDVTL